MNYSMVYSGLVTVFVLPFLGEHFTEACTGEIMSYVLMIPGALLIAYGRFRLGGVNALGFK